MNNYPNIEDVVEIAENAGRIIMDFYEKEFEIFTKHDDSPVTDADLAASHYIEEKLLALNPLIPVISEENTSKSAKHSQDKLYWLVDPLDGTKGFINRNGQFSVNIALVANQVPVLGVVYVPIVEASVFTDSKLVYHKPLQENKELIQKPSKGELKTKKIVASSTHLGRRTQDYIQTIHASSVEYMSSARKYYMLATGQANIYPCFGRTMEWDTAAGHAILLAHGGDIKTTEGQTLTYGKELFVNPGFIAGYIF